MEIHMRVFTTLPALVAVCASVLCAQRPKMGPPSGAYNPATETKIIGTVEAVVQQAHDHMLGTHLTVKTQDGLKTVLLGPSDFVSSKALHSENVIQSKSWGHKSRQTKQLPSSPGRLRKTEKRSNFERQMVARNGRAAWGAGQCLSRNNVWRTFR